MTDDQFSSISKQIADLGNQIESKLAKGFAAQDSRIEQRFAEQDAKFEKRFAEHDKRFDAIDARLDHHDIVLDRIAAEVTKKADKADLDALADRIDAKFGQLFDYLDSVVKEQETHEHERLAANRQLDRHETWIGKASKQLHVSYDPAG